MSLQMEKSDGFFSQLILLNRKLECLHKVEELVTQEKILYGEFLSGITEIIPTGMRHPQKAKVHISYFGHSYESRDFQELPLKYSRNLIIRGDQIGNVDVYYPEFFQDGIKAYFNEEETSLIKYISDRIEYFIELENLKTIYKNTKNKRKELSEGKDPEWRILADLSRRMDHELYLRISRKMLNHLCYKGIDEANRILRRLSSDSDSYDTSDFEGSNRPRRKQEIVDLLAVGQDIFEIAQKYLPDADIFNLVEKWMQEDRASFLIRTLISLDSSLGDIADAIRRFIHLAPEGVELSESTRKGVKVAMVRRFITDQLDFIKIAKNYVEVDGFYELLQRMIYPAGSHGQIGGKSAGLFLAWQIIKSKKKTEKLFENVIIPRTWIITSDGLHNFMSFNNLEEVTEQKYKDLELVRQEYQHIIQLFKNSQFSPDIIQGLSVALDDLGNNPIIVRSSSLLEDRFGSAFSGKYKSLFLANQGTKNERLTALMDAIAEVYSSTFGSDPIEYRIERNLLDFREEMGIIIQEVVGKKVGRYYLPAFAGVAFSNNEFRWSPRIKRKDGLVRLVPGLGTRAVDRLSDDFPIMFAPGRPGLQVNITREEIIRYSPKKMDVINLDTNSFETIEVDDFLKEYGDEFPAAMQLISQDVDGKLQQPSFLTLDFEHDDLIVTFDNLLNRTPFVKQMKEMLKLLQDVLESPVDIEFASDGEKFYLLQCRPQSFGADSAPSVIPKDIPESAIVFSANKYISNGQVPDIEYIVYVDPQNYSEIEDLGFLMQIGSVVGRLNKKLPKRKFILMGPGRWGSRGDIKLGVNVTYSDINNTAVLIEIARQKGNYVPDLSFGTHFFQDLVEASIRYIPLYPDDTKVIFNENFLANSPNALTEISPEMKSFEKIVRVIDVKKVTEGKVLKVYMNADVDMALGVLTQPNPEDESAAHPQIIYSEKPVSENHWSWRYHIAENLAAQISYERFGVKGAYLFGSTKNRSAEANSDIDLLVHFVGTQQQKNELMVWLDGWDKSLCEMNYLKTGVKSTSLLDVHFVSDEEIDAQEGYASKIDSLSDAAVKLRIGD